MPTYVYGCTKCRHQFEEFQSITAPPRQRCPKCRGKVKRLPTAGAGVVFKGSGFYETDYKRKAAPPAEKKTPKKESKPSTEAKGG